MLASNVLPDQIVISVYLDTVALPKGFGKPKSTLIPGMSEYVASPGVLVSSKPNHG